MSMPVSLFMKVWYTLDYWFRQLLSIITFLTLTTKLGSGQFTNIVVHPEVNMFITNNVPKTYTMYQSHTFDSIIV